MKLNQFRYLVAIAEHGSIAKAARALYTSQPSISQSMKELEEELGFSILVRDRIGTTFTPQGQRVLEVAQNIMRELNKLDKLTVKSGEELWGNLAISGTPYFSNSLLLETIVALRKSQPKLTIRLEETSSQSVLDLLHDGVINLGVILQCNLDEIFFKIKMQDYGLRATPLFEDEMVFVAHKDHPLAKQGTASMNEILSYPVIQYKSDINEMTLQVFRQYRKDLDLLYIDDFNSLWRLPLIGPYLFLSPSLALSARNTRDLCSVRISDLDYHGTVSWVHSAEPLSEAEHAVVAMLQEVSALLVDSRDERLPTTTLY